MTSGCTWLVLLVALSLVSCGGGSTPAAPTPAPSPQPTAQAFVVVSPTGDLAEGLDFQVDTDRQQRTWLTRGAEGMQATYPSGQQWGFVAAVIAGTTAPGSRVGRNMSAYRTLQLEMRGAAGGESVEIGIKDNTDPDDGSEAKRTEVLSSGWQTYSYPLSDFRTADLTRVYLLFEIVFNGASGRTVYFRNVRYSP